MDVYKIVYNGKEDEGVYGVSIVDAPANEHKFVAMTEADKKKLNEITLKVSDKEKRLLTGVVLEADQKIYRNENGYEYFIYFDAPTIEKLSQDFLSRGFIKNSKLNHQGDWLEGISVVEQWLVSDNKCDKAVALGFEVENGSWLMTYKLSEELWNDYVKTGKVKGFSIDAFLAHEKVQVNMKEKTKNENIIMSKLNKIWLKLIGDEEPITISIEGFGDIKVSKLDEGGTVVKVTEDGEESIGAAEFAYEGFIYETDENGIIISKKEQEVEVEDEVEVEVEAEKDCDCEGEEGCECDKEKEVEASSEVKMEDVGVSAYIELPVGIWTIGDKIYTVIEKTEGEGDDAYTYNVIDTIVEVGAEASVEEVEAEEDEDKEEIKEKEEELSKRVAELMKRVESLSNKPNNTRLKARVEASDEKVIKNNKSKILEMLREKK